MTQGLIEHALDGDESAARALHSSHYPAVFRLAFMLLQNREDADDATQEAFVYAFTHLDRYDPERSSFASWLKIIVTSRCRDLQRRQQTATISLQDLTQSGRELEDTTADHQPNAVLEKIELHQTVWTALNQVPTKSRQALILRYYGALSYPEMARALRCPVGTVKSRVAYGLRALSELLKSEGLVFIENTDESGGDKL